ncbi:zinc-binding dehydrogenase [Octadecabacter sp. 1_MG-2023]|uniref:zinc-dependent alcohol dehydrogenase n=1 Tax=unclassified Octadecabacter TaxID=196158 RepID=UPI001C092C81|nr:MULTISPECIES: zinc-binding dehydrogenase [unclassified Octadecabacter]MBU2991721.1 zinc-binding dehydrogenase [Octadecabacter sp. B2R22]MDO6735694.1 zinc-binding dehydrogenase [Octadecabacter sp. 1_MG-2023]
MNTAATHQQELNGLGDDVPSTMRAWVLGDPDELKLIEKPTPKPNRAEVLVRIDAVAICATDLEIISYGTPALIEGGSPFNKNYTPGHEYMGTVAALGPGVDEFEVGDRVTVEIHAGCGQCKRCRMGMYTSCHNYGLNYGDHDKGHRANGFTTDGGFAEYAVNNINTMIRVPDDMSDEEATLVVTAGTSMYGLTELGGLVAGESVVVIGPGPIGLLAVAVAKALGASPVVLVGTRESRNAIGSKLGADHVIDARNEDVVARVKELTGKGADYVVDCAGTEATVNQAVEMTNRGGRICLAAFPKSAVSFNLGALAVNNIYLYGIRGEGKSATHRAMAFMAAGRFDASLIHTHTFPLEDLPTALKYARERIDDAIKVVVSTKPGVTGGAKSK